MIKNTSISVALRAIISDVANVLGNRRSILLSYGGNGSFPRVPPFSGQRETRDMRNAPRFASAQKTAQPVHGTSHESPSPIASQESAQ